MNMTKKRVAELEGAQLDWAVAVASGEPLSVDAWQSSDKPGTLPFVMVGTGEGDKRVYYPSSSWCHGGQIIERERIGLASQKNLEGSAWEWVACKGGYDNSYHTNCVHMVAATPLIAAMRAFVASKLGDEVEVPE